MYFTEEDYKKIERWLAGNSVKDTEFPVTSGIDGSELLPIVQDYKNKVVNINYFLDWLGKRLSSFINVSSNTCKYNISLEEAISLVSPYMRSPGMVISFLDEDGNWQVLQFKGTCTEQWCNTDMWEELPQYKLREELNKFIESIKPISREQIDSLFN